MSTGTQNQIYGNPNFRPLKVRDSLQFVRGNVSAFEHEGGENGVASVVGPNSTPGAHPNAPFAVGSYTAFGAQFVPGNIRSIDSEILFNYPVAYGGERGAGTGGVYIQTNPFPLASQGGTPTNTAAASIAAVRGAIIVGGTYATGANGIGGAGTGTNGVDPAVTVATTIVDGYLFGVQGKVVVRGSIVSPNPVTAIIGQLDLSSAVSIAPSGGPVSGVSALWLDAGAVASAAIIAAPTQVNLATLTNTTAATINALIYVPVSKATYFMDMTGSSVFTKAATALGSQTGAIAIKDASGTIGWIPFYASAT